MEQIDAEISMFRASAKARAECLEPLRGYVGVGCRARAFRNSCRPKITSNPAMQATAATGIRIARSEVITAPPSSRVETIGLPNPAVVIPEAARVTTDRKSTRL